MRRETITKGKIIELTREILRGFYSRSIDDLTEYLSDNFVWIGAFDFQYSINKKQFLAITESELNSTPFKIDFENYDLISRDRDTLILCCRINLSNPLCNGDILQTHTRLTVIWKYIDNNLKLIHIHGSNAQDIPLTVQNKIDETNSSDDFINYITNAVPNQSSPTKMFRLSTGEHRIFSEEEILYLQSDGQNTKIHTKDECLTISGILRVHQPKLSDAFLRIHKSYLINTAYISSFKRYVVKLHNDIELPIGKEKFLALKQLYNKKS
ncbi:MAG: LytTR family transcriptional regulator [Clostridia bacterium]